MSGTTLRTIKGQSLTSELITELSQKFDRDWQDTEITVKSTSYANALAALHYLDLSVGVIEALERRAKNRQEPFPYFLRSILQNELVTTEG
jgi:hypothetical protein